MTCTHRVASDASSDRLEHLIELRLQPGADKARIDARIWDLFGERWAVMFTDLSGFSRRVAEFGVIHFLQVIHESQRLLIPHIDDHDGILLKCDGDSMLVIFRSVAKALECSLAMQRALAAYDRDRAEEDQVLLCVGLGFGDVLRIGDADVFGAEVNAASKLGEDMARPWEILVTDQVRSALAGRTDVRFEPLAEKPPGAEAAHRVVYKLA
jgi:class 3 adenylate cyclase